MASYALTCCSTADLSPAHFADRDIRYVCFHYFLDNVEYPDDMGQSVPFPEFYAAMAAGAETRTAQVNADEYEQFWTPMLEQGQDILHVCLSSGLSGTINSANAAAEVLRARFPERKIYVVDSLGASSGYGLLMDTLADLRDEGMDVDTLHAWVLAHRLELHHWFFSTDLAYYVKGGRISKAAGFIGGLLNICPLLNMNDEGKLIPREKIPSKKRVIKEIVRKMEQCAKDGLEYAGKCYISMSACLEDAQKVAKLVEETFTKLKGKVEIYDVGTTIGSHTGPGTVALFFWGCPRGN